MVRTCSAASAYNVYQSLVGHCLDLNSHFFRSLVISSHFIREPGVRIAADGSFAPSVHVLYKRHEFGCSK